jgi:hypothetical protein
MRFAALMQPAVPLPSDDELLARYHRLKGDDLPSVTGADSFHRLHAFFLDYSNLFLI